MSSRVWIVTQLRDGELHPASREAIVAGRALAEALGTTADAVVMGSAVNEVAAGVASLGVSAVRVADRAELGDYVPGPYTETLLAGVADGGPEFLVFPHTYQSVDYMARVAHGWGAAVLSEVVSFAPDDEGLAWVRPILEGKLQARVRLRGEGPVVVSVQSGAFTPAEAAAETATIESQSGPAELVAERELLGIEDAGGDTVDLSAANMIVSVGRGIGGPDRMSLIEDLAAALGAEIGASRPVIDNGWLPRDRQIGSSGQTVAPKLYLAVGISGAIQHLVGMKGSGCTVAINKDPGAPIFNVSDYGIVGDLFEVVPAVTKALQESA
ncbi:MAG: electron transfer flavoprotein subunit alpha/FixB family protein [Acidobacteriota bacterium]|nr:electron transfer flavoprotein subunit alpha/FixB family protein [Acidobacteriota bacterium]